MVEGNRETQQGIDDVGVVIQLLVHHQSQDAHLSGTAVVEFNSQLLVDSGLIPSRSLQLSSFDFFLAKTETYLQKTDESDKLESASSGDSVEGSKAGLDGRERDSRGNVCKI